MKPESGDVCETFDGGLGFRISAEYSLKIVAEASMRKSLLSSEFVIKAKIGKSRKLEVGS